MASTPRVSKSVNGLSALDAALTAWIDRGKGALLLRWLNRELDHDGVPRTLAIEEWEEGLRRVFAARNERLQQWPEEFDAVIEGWFRAHLRFARPGGLISTSKSEHEKARSTLYRGWADSLSDAGLATVVDWWFPRPSRSRHSPPPLPADARPDRALAILRANWSRDGDFLSIDHRAAGMTTTFELFGSGIPWLASFWKSEATLSESCTRPRPSLWSSHSSADVLEWSYSVGKGRVTRSALLLRGRKLALLGEQWEGPGDPGAFSMDLAESVHATPIPECRGVALKHDRSRSSAHVYPIGLPKLPYATDRGEFCVDGRRLILKQPGSGEKRRWRSLLVSWDPKRNRLPVHWRTLTVSENAKECPPGTAFASRITWGRDDTLLIYRSLSRPGLRACLGHQTRSKFLIGLFTSEGEVEPLLKIDE